jgi:hypothetical protein
VRRALRRQALPAIHDYVSLYDHQLRSWLRACTEQLIEAYEFQASVFREQLRRLTVDVEGIGTPAEVGDLLADLQELERPEAVEPLRNKVEMKCGAAACGALTGADGFV